MKSVEVTVYHLEMLARSRLSLARLDDLSVIYVQLPTVPYYRSLYDAVGKGFNWVSRQKLSDEALAAIISDPQNELHVLWVDGISAGFAELDRRQPDEVELVFFGLMPEFIGKGLGKWFLQWTIDKAWGYEPKRFWLHTCTLDHPAALPNYLKAGFVLFKQETEEEEID